MRIMQSAMPILIAAVLLWSCSGGNNGEEEKGKIEAMTEEIGQEAVRAIKSPIEKAQAVADQEEKRARETDRANSE